MPLITWNETLSVKVKSLDEQHQHLIALINQLFDAMSEGRGKDVMGQIFDELVDYTHTHFSNEERMMEAVNYPGLEQHKAEHDDLTKQVLDLRERFREGQIGITIEMLTFLKDWVSSHIQKTDKKYSTALQ